MKHEKTLLVVALLLMVVAVTIAGSSGITVNWKFSAMADALKALTGLVTCITLLIGLPIVIIANLRQQTLSSRMIFIIVFEVAVFLSFLVWVLHEIGK